MQEYYVEYYLKYILILKIVESKIYNLNIWIQSIFAADTFQVRCSLYVSIKCNLYALSHNQQYSERVTSISI